MDIAYLRFWPNDDVMLLTTALLPNSYKDELRVIHPFMWMHRCSATTETLVILLLVLWTAQLGCIILNYQINSISMYTRATLKLQFHRSWISTST